VNVLPPEILSTPNLHGRRRPVAEKKITDEFKEQFVEMLGVLPNVTAVCRLMDINTSNISRARGSDEKFDNEIKRAIEEGYDMLEEEARRRAVDGVEKPVFYRGEEVGSVREYSDTLLKTLLKGYRPKKFNPGIKVEGGDGEKVTMVFKLGGD
jgi:hypothetical protein